MEPGELSIREKRHHRLWYLEVFKENFGKDLFHIDGEERVLNDYNLPRLWVCEQGTGRKASMLNGSKAYKLTHGRRL